MDEGFDWYDPEQTGALIESQQAELIELREEGVRLRAENERQTAGWEKALSDLQQYQTHILDLETDNERLRGVIKVAEQFVWQLYRESGKLPEDPAKQVWLDLKHALEG